MDFKGIFSTQIKRVLKILVRVMKLKIFISKINKLNNFRTPSEIPIFQANSEQYDRFRPCDEKISL